MLNPSETDKLLNENGSTRASQTFYTDAQAFLNDDNGNHRNSIAPNTEHTTPRPNTPTLWSKKKVFTVNTSAVFLTLLLIWLTLSGDKNDFTAIGNWLTKMLGLDSIKDWEANGLLAGAAATTSMFFGGGAAGIQKCREPSDEQLRARAEQQRVVNFFNQPEEEELYTTGTNHTRDLSVGTSAAQTRPGSFV